MKKIIGLGLGVLSLAAFASATYESVFAGKEIIKKPGGTVVEKDCQLKVIKTHYVGNTGKWEDFRAEVETSYSHHGEEPDQFILQPSKKAGEADLLTATNTEGNTLRLVVETSGKFETAASYTLIVPHSGHNHKNTCTKLKVVAKP